MIGVETAAPGKTNPYGATHDAKAVKGEFTSTGGTKFSFDGIETQDRPDNFKAHREAGLILSHNGGLKINIKPEQYENTVATVSKIDDSNFNDKKIIDLNKKVRVTNQLKNTYNDARGLRSSIKKEAPQKPTPLSESDKRKSLMRRISEKDIFKKVDPVKKEENKPPEPTLITRKKIC
jgi:hypothetical protein